MKGKRQKRVNVGMMILAFLAMGILFASYSAAIAKDRDAVQGLVDKARITFNDFMHDSNYVWLHENIDHAKGILIFPQVIKGGFIWGGSGGTGVLMVRDERTGPGSGKSAKRGRIAVPVGRVKSSLTARRS